MNPSLSPGDSFSRSIPLIANALLELTFRVSTASWTGADSRRWSYAHSTEIAKQLRSHCGKLATIVCDTVETCLHRGRPGLSLSVYALPPPRRCFGEESIADASPAGRLAHGRTNQSQHQ